MKKLDAIKAMLLSATVYGALTNPEKHESQKDYTLTLDMDGENPLGEPAITLTMNLKSLPYVTELLIAGRLTTEVDRKSVV